MIAPLRPPLRRRPASSTARARSQQSCGPPTCTSRPVDRGGHPDRRRGPEVGGAPGTGRPRCCAAATMAGPAGARESVSAAAASAQDVVGVAAIRWPCTAVTVGSPLVRVPVLSNSTVSTVRIALQRQPVLDQHAAAGSAFGGDRDHQRDRQAERVRAGDHQHGDRADHRLVGLAEQRPDDRGEQRRRRGRTRTASRRPGRRSAAPGRSSSARRRPAAGCRPVRCPRPTAVTLDPQPGVGGDGAGHHGVADGRGGRVGTRR